MPLAALTWFGLNMLLVLVATRLLGLGLREGWHRVDSRIGWQVWATERLLDMARDLLFPSMPHSSPPSGCACLVPRSGATSRPRRSC